jgi:hypothetical protein
MKSWDDYKGILPYASELFGIYQPLLGWKSRITGKRFDKFRNTMYRNLAQQALSAQRAPLQVQLDRVTRAELAASGHTTLSISNLKPVIFSSEVQPHLAPTIDTGISRLLQRDIGNKPPEDWKRLITTDSMTKLLEKLKAIISKPAELQNYPDIAEYIQSFTTTLGASDQTTLVQSLFDKEARVSGYLIFLAQHSPAQLSDLFFIAPKADLFNLSTTSDPLLSFGANNYHAILSPVGIVHLYREYFFEFDSFLGPPVGHVWLSPGGTVELIEITTRKTFVEKTLEQSTEITTKSESNITTQDDVADAVKDENRSDVKFGFTNTASYSSPVFQDTATASFSLDNAKMNSRETTHKRMRQQSEKLSSEIKRNFKSTFKTSTETTDTSSKRYLLQNTTDKLVNYELRRKMRKVGVQVQDIGVQMCWHTFVDDAGRDLGLGQLVHIGEPPELGDLVQPDQPEIPQPKAIDVSINIPFVGIDTDDTDNAYTDGTETEVGFLDSTEHIQPDFTQEVTYPSPNYTLVGVTLDSQGNDAKVSARNLQSADGSSKGTFVVHLDYVAWHDQNNINIKATLNWAPTDSARDKVQTEYDKRMGDYNAEKTRRFKEAFYKASRERIKLASQIQPRPSEDLREEERNVVYRKLISQLMSVGTTESKHVISELVRSIFDVDKMLYFVAPEWWMPRLHRSTQHLGEAPGAQPTPSSGGGIGASFVGSASVGTYAQAKSKAAYIPKDLLTFGTSAPSRTVIPTENIVDWGGGKEKGRDNYYITEDSSPAKLGSSLGWLLQLDGDNLRNAMLNSPWVKAVIPIRLGKEKEAINWLQQAHVEGSDGLDAEYVAAADDPVELHSTPGHTVTVRGALDFLIEKIHSFDQHSRTPIVPDPGDPEAPSNHFAGSLPTEAVFEHGFYPLKGGVRFDQDGTEQAVFSQWMEILPTDQVVALQVEYDPKTLQIKEPPDA